jgi:hypothetical protein
LLSDSKRKKETLKETEDLKRKILEESQKTMQKLQVTSKYGSSSVKV